MSRPLRIEFPGALYHVTSRGDGRENIYLDDIDRVNWLEVFSEVCERFNWLCHAYCLMSNHYHLLIETPDSNLSLGMRQLNGVYTQRFNRKHRRVGHVFQGRYKAILVDKEIYLLELARYIVLNPVRAQMVRSAKNWIWSSYQQTAGLTLVDEFSQLRFLQVDWVLSHFSSSRKQACLRYRDFVEEGKGQPAPWGQLKNQIFLGEQEFVDQTLAMIDADNSLEEVPQGQKRNDVKPISFFKATTDSRNEAIVKAYKSGGFNMKELANLFQLHYSSISKIIRKN